MRTNLLMACGLAWLLCLQSNAATFPIANGDVATLATAITTCNTNNQDDTIELATGGSYLLTSALPQIAADTNHKLIIHGNGATLQRSTASGTANFRIFTTQGGSNVAISGLTMSNGHPNSDGGAIYANFQEDASSTLTIDNCTFSGNAGFYGGAILNDGYNDANLPPHTATLVVTNSTFVSNTAAQYGGAIWNQSGGVVVNVTNCTFAQNSAVRSAGAVQIDGSTGTAIGNVINCTFTQNSAGNYGGGLNVDGAGGSDSNGVPASGSAIVNVINCTFDRNTASWGGGIALDGSSSGGTSGNATVKVDSCTFNANTATTLGGGFYLSQTGTGTTALQIGNSIAKAGSTGANFSVDNLSGGTAAIASQGYNLSSDPANGGTGTAPAGFLNHLGDIRNTDPLLDPAGLSNNGGPTQTIGLQAASPALDHGKSNTISANPTDQRGEHRPFDDPAVANASGGDASDIGAYEADVRAVDSKRVGNEFIIYVSTIIGRTYEVQSRPSLTSGTWTNVTNTIPAPPISGTGGIVPVRIPNASAFAIDFYHVIQL